MKERINMGVLVLVLIVLWAGCTATTKQVNTATQGPDLLYRTKCAVCHRLYPPQKHTYQKFQTYVTRYGKGLSAEERQRLLEYLKENAKQEQAESIGFKNKQIVNPL